MRSQYRRESTGSSVLPYVGGPDAGDEDGGSAHEDLTLRLPAHSHAVVRVTETEGTTDGGGGGGGVALHRNQRPESAQAHAPATSTAGADSDAMSVVVPCPAMETPPVRSSLVDVGWGGGKGGEEAKGLRTCPSMVLPFPLFYDQCFYSLKAYNTSSLNTVLYVE